MNLQKFDELMQKIDADRIKLAQIPSEWQQFMEYIAGYFKNRGIERPVIIEIGILANAQKQFYEELMDAEHVGIDIDENTHPDILGDSRLPETIEKLMRRLGGRPIDLIFIDGDHSYESVKKDFENYAPMTKHIVVFHDINNKTTGVYRLWNEIMKKENGYFLIMLKAECHSGIGLVVKP